VSGNFSGVYFENNAGVADIWLSNSAESAAASISGCSFARIDSTNYVTNNIYVETSGSGITQAVNVAGCGFKYFNTYVPNSGRKYINTSTSSGGTSTVGWSGCVFQSEIEKPTIVNEILLALSDINSSNLIGTIDTARLPSNISIAGNISSGGYLFGNGSFLTGVSTSLTGNGFAISSINAANLVGNIEADLNFAVGSVPGNALYGQLDGDVVFTGDIDANVLVGNVDLNLNFSPGTVPGSALYGEIYANIGNVTAPGFTFINNTTTGLYRPAANTLGFTCGGVETAQISTQGLVVKTGSNVAPSMTFSSNTSVGLYLDSGNVVSSSTNLQVPSGIVTAMNTTTTVTGSMPAYINALGCSVHSASAPGVSTGLVTPGIGSFNSYDVLGLVKLSDAIYDFWRTYVNLATGTYTFRMHHSKTTATGIVTVVVGSTTVGTIDTYTASAVDAISDLTGVVITSPGLYKVELQVNSKNASSSNYYFLWRGAAFIRTS
jgi:hypothetical protein